MKPRILFVFVVLMLTTFVGAEDISNLLTDQRFVQRQIHCILDLGRCDLIGKKIKGLLPEALNNNCRRCTPRQMEHARTLIQFMQHNYPNEWHEIVRRYAAMRYLRRN